jgi:ribosome-binding protein aMBF1 (putative translation factor)
LGLSISRLSQEAKVNASVVSWVELGKLAASPPVRAALAKFYKEPESVLFYESGLAI